MIKHYLSAIFFIFLLFVFLSGCDAFDDHYEQGVEEGYSSGYQDAQIDLANKYDTIYHAMEEECGITYSEAYDILSDMLDGRQPNPADIKAIMALLEDSYVVLY